MKQGLLEAWQQCLRAWLEADEAGLEALLASRPNVMWVGPDPGALWQGRAAILDGLRAAGTPPALSGAVPVHVDAYDGGTWGWMLYVGQVQALTLRVSSVWLREGDAWRLFALHADVAEQVPFPAQPGALLTGAHQTMGAWARRIETVTQVPLVYRSALAERLDTQAPFPYMVLIPPFEDALLRLPEQVVFEQDGILHILRRKGDWVEARAYRLAEVCALEMGLVLLQSWLTVVGPTLEGAWEMTSLAFNAATRPLLMPFVQRVRMMYQGAVSDAVAALPADLPEKFAHYVRESLLPGTSVVSWLWRPDITLTEALSSLWPFYRAERVNHLTLLTHAELILIWDQMAERAGEEEAYGGVWLYIPLRHVTDVALHEAADGSPSLVVTLCGKITVERRFTVNQRIELEALVRQIGAAVQAVAE